MEWEIIISSLITSVSFMSVVVFILKKSIEKLIESRLEKFKIQTKADIDEIYRRQARFFDKLLDAERLLLSEAYRARNIVKYEIKKAIEFNKREKLAISIDKLHKIIEDLGKILISERLILGERVFSFAHDYKHALLKFHIHVMKELEKPDLKSSERSISHIVSLESLFEDLSDYIKESYEFIREKD